MVVNTFKGEAPDGYEIDHSEATMRVEPGVVSEQIDQHIEDEKSVHAMAEDLRQLLAAFAAKYAEWVSSQDINDVNLHVFINGRTNGDIAITFGTTVYHNYRTIDISGYNDINALMEEFSRRYQADKKATVPLLTHRS